MNRNKIPKEVKSRKRMSYPTAELAFTKETNALSSIIDIHQGEIQRFINSNKRITVKDEAYKGIYNLQSEYKLNRSYNFPTSTKVEGVIFENGLEFNIMFEINWDTRDIFNLKMNEVER